METTRKSVYPNDRVDLVGGTYQVDDEDYVQLTLDHCIKPHYFDRQLPNKYSLKKQFKQLSKPNEVASGTNTIHADIYKVNQSKISTLIKLGYRGESCKKLIEKLNVKE